MTTNVPSPTWTPTGFVAPPESTVLTGVQEDMNAAFGGNLNFTTNSGSPTNPTPQGQLSASTAAIIGNVNDNFLYYSTQTDPAYAEGRMQDAIGRIYFMERNPATFTTLQVTCTGAVGTIITIGATVVDPSGNLYVATAAGTIGVNGTVAVQFVAQVSGTIAVPETVTIYQSIAGWDVATLVSGVEGSPVESRGAFESRRAQSTAANSIGSLPSILGAVLNTPGVLQAYVYENTTGSPQSVNGATIAGNSVYVAAYGGVPAQVAQAIWTRKGPGCGYAAGNTSVTVFDTSPGYVVPYPSYTVTYTIPNPLQLLIAVTIVNSVMVPGNATSLVQNACVQAAAGNPNNLNIIDGPAAQIGSKVYASRFVPSIASLGTWAEGNIISINIGSNNNSDAAFANGSCNGSLLTITSLVSGTISAGQTVAISNGSGVIIPGTLIVNQVSGTTGGTGVYSISNSQQITGNLAGGTTLLGFAKADQTNVQVQINQIPQLAAANVSVTFQ